MTSLLAVTIEFQQSQYNVQEDQIVVEICVVLSGAIGVPVLANLTLNSGGRADPNRDFQFQPTSVMFIPAGSFIVCNSIPIIQDEVIEDNEDFSLTLSSDVAGVIVSISETVVTIEDSTLASVTFLNATSFVPEGNVALLCFMNAVTFERDVIVQISFDFSGGT